MSVLAPTPEAMADIRIAIVAFCDKCKHWHDETISPFRLLTWMEAWDHKHPAERDCRTHFLTKTRPPKRGFDDRYYDQRGEGPWWLDSALGTEYTHNTDFKPTYGASAAVTNAIESLATSATWVAGYESDVIDNTTDKYSDIWLSGKTTVGTTPTTNTLIEHSSVSMTDDSEWPDVFDGTTGAETVTSVGVKAGICKPIVFLNVDSNTSNRVYGYTKRSLAELYGGICPPKSVVFTAHNTGVNLNSTGSNHELHKAGTYITGA